VDADLSTNEERLECFPEALVSIEPSLFESPDLVTSEAGIVWSVILGPDEQVRSGAIKEQLSRVLRSILVRFQLVT
jgi:hypothetical protein